MLQRFKKRTLVLVTVAAVLVLGGVAFAYWTNTGSGTGTAQTGTNNSLVITQTSSITGLAPGQPPQELAGAVENPNNDSPVFVNSVTAVVSETDSPGCGASDYTISGSAPVNAEVPPNGSVPWSGLTIQFNNKPTVNQDACKGAEVVIRYTAN